MNAGRVFPYFSGNDLLLTDSFLALGFSVRLISSRFVSSAVYPLPNARNGGAQNGCKSSLVFKGLFCNGFSQHAISASQ